MRVSTVRRFSTARRCWTLPVVVLLLGLATVAGAETDEARAKIIVGTWVGQEPGADFVVRGEATYRANGTYGGVLQLDHGPDHRKLNFPGTWRVENGTLYSKITGSSEPQVLPKGKLIVDKIASLTEDTLILTSDDGAKLIRTRKSNP